MADRDYLPIYEPDGTQLSIDDSGRARLDKLGQRQPSGASMSGPVPRYGVKTSMVVHPATVPGMAGTMPMQAVAPAKRPENRKPTPEELEVWAEQMRASIESELESPSHSTQVQTDGQGAPDWLRNYMAPSNDSRLERTR